MEADNPAIGPDLSHPAQQMCRDAELQAVARMAIPLQQHIVYGPVRSRRLGRSLGINVLPIGVKVCNMNCAYCQYGWTRGARRVRDRSCAWPTPEGVEAAVAERLTRAGEANEWL